MVGFNGFFAFCLLNAFENVGVNCTLREVINVGKLTSFVGKYVDKFGADNLSLLFGVGNVFK